MKRGHKMGVADVIGKVFHKNKKSYTLTDLGKRCYDEWDTREGGFRLDVLVYLNEHSSATTSQIAEGMRIPEKTVAYILNDMEEAGWVIKRGSDGKGG